jgi:hypothetical protein
MTIKRKKKGLPDLRPRSYTFPEKPDEKGHTHTPPAPQAIHHLAKKHGFPRDLDLATELTERWFWWRAYIEIGPGPQGSERRRFLQQMASRAGALEEGLDKIGSADRTLILETSPQLALDSLRRSVHELGVAAQFAARRVPKSRAGRRGDPDTIELLCKLWRLYHKAFGANAPRITRSGEKYSGRFFEFANDVLRLFDIRKTNNALGKAIEKAQSVVDSSDPAEAIP